MDKTLAAIYAVTRIDFNTLPGHRPTSKRQGATAESKSKRIEILSSIFTLGLAIPIIKETLPKKQSD